MKNKLTDLNNHLFMQMERLGDEDLTAEGLEKEVARADALVAVSDKIINNAELNLRAAKLIAEHGGHLERHLPLIGKQSSQESMKNEKQTD